MKKLLSTLLIAAMVLCYMPAMAFAGANDVAVAVPGLNANKDVTVVAGSVSANAHLGNGEVTIDKTLADKLAADYLIAGKGNAVTGTATIKDKKAILVIPENAGITVGGTDYLLKGETTIKFDLTNKHTGKGSDNLDAAGIAKYMSLYANSVAGNITVTQAPRTSIVDPTPEVKPGDQVVDKDTTTKPDGTKVDTEVKKDTAAGTTTKTEVETKGDKVEAKVDVAVDTKTTTAADGTVSAKVEDKVADAAIEKAKKEAEAVAKENAGKDVKVQTNVTIEATAKDADKVEVKVAAAAVAKIAAEENMGLQVKTEAAALTFDKKALEKVKEPAAGAAKAEVAIAVEKPALAVVPEEVKLVASKAVSLIDVKVRVNGESVTNFGLGTVDVALKLPSAEVIADPAAIYVRYNGLAFDMGGIVHTENGIRFLQFETNHFSYYAVVDKAVAEAEVEKTNAHLTEGVEATTLTGAAKAYTKDGKSRIKLTWKKSKGFKVDGYEVFKSTKKYSGFGTKAYYKTKDGSKNYYINTKQLKKGTRYYFNIKGYRMIDGKKVYTQKIKVSAIAK